MIDDMTQKFSEILVVVAMRWSSFGDDRRVIVAMNPISFPFKHSHNCSSWMDFKWRSMRLQFCQNYQNFIHWCRNDNQMWINMNHQRTWLMYWCTLSGIYCILYACIFWVSIFSPVPIRSPLFILQKIAYWWNWWDMAVTACNFVLITDFWKRFLPLNKALLMQVPNHMFQLAGIMPFHISTKLFLIVVKQNVLWVLSVINP